MNFYPANTHKTIVLRASFAEGGIGVFCEDDLDGVVLFPEIIKYAPIPPPTTSSPRRKTSIFMPVCDVLLTGSILTGEISGFITGGNVFPSI